MPNTSFLTRALVSGTVAGLATSAVAAVAGKRETASYAAPLNATSHIFWGDEAARQDGASVKYTVTGFLLDHLAAMMWAAVHEKKMGRTGNVALVRDPPFASAAGHDDKWGGSCGRSVRHGLLPGPKALYAGL